MLMCSWGPSLLSWPAMLPARFQSVCHAASLSPPSLSFNNKVNKCSLLCSQNRLAHARTPPGMTAHRSFRNFTYSHSGAAVHVRRSWCPRFPQRPHTRAFGALPPSSPRERMRRVRGRPAGRATHCAGSVVPSARSAPMPGSPTRADASARS